MEKTKLALKYKNDLKSRKLEFENIRLPLGHHRELEKKRLESEQTKSDMEYRRSMMKKDLLPANISDIRKLKTQYLDDAVMKNAKKKAGSTQSGT